MDMRTNLNRLGAAMVGFGVALCLAFTTPTQPARHPTIQTSGADVQTLCEVSGASSTSIICNPIAGTTATRGAGTAGSGTGISLVSAGAIRPYVNVITVTFAAMTAAATTDVTIWTPFGHSRILRLVAEATVTFSGGALSNVTMTCGTTAGGNQYLTTCDLGVTETPVCGDAAADIGAALLSATVADFPSWAAGTTAIQCRFTCTGANCNAATGGSATFYIEGVTYP